MRVNFLLPKVAGQLNVRKGECQLCEIEWILKFFKNMKANCFVLEIYAQR